MTALPNNHFAVQVPEGATQIIISPTHSTIQWKEKGFENKPYWDIKILPPGSYTIVGLADSITEEQAGEIVEQIKDEYGFAWVDYKHRYNVHNTALESFRSLLSSLSLPPETTLIIKKH